MSLLTPVKVPVKVYRWDDAGAPTLDKTAGCMMTIFKACLITGYGTKEPAGWTMPFEDTATGVKVFRPPVTADTDYYLRCSQDTGTAMKAQVYKDMTDKNTGDLKLQCDGLYAYAAELASNKWCLIASPRGFWFSNEHSFQSNEPSGWCGSYFYCNYLTSSSSSTFDALYLQHSGGSTAYASSGITGVGYGGGIDKSSTYYNVGKLLLNDVIYSCDIYNSFDGRKSITSEPIKWQAFTYADNKVYFCPSIYIPWDGAQHSNFTILDNEFDIGRIMAFNTSTRKRANIMIGIDSWSY